MSWKITDDEKINYQKEITILSVDQGKNRALEYIQKQGTELKGETDKSIIKTVNNIIFLSVTDRVAKQKITKNTEEVNIPSTNNT